MFRNVQKCSQFFQFVQSVTRNVSFSISSPHFKNVYKCLKIIIFFLQTLPVLVTVQLMPSSSKSTPIRSDPLSFRFCKGCSLRPGNDLSLKQAFRLKIMSFVVSLYQYGICQQKVQVFRRIVIKFKNRPVNNETLLSLRVVPCLVLPCLVLTCPVLSLVLS